MEKHTAPKQPDWSKWGARPMTREEIAAEKALIQKLRDEAKS